MLQFIWRDYVEIHSLFIFKLVYAIMLLGGQRLCVHHKRRNYNHSYSRYYDKLGYKSIGGGATTLRGFKV